MKDMWDINFFPGYRGLETKGSKLKISYILKRAVRGREAKREEQHRIPVVHVKVGGGKRK